MYIPKFFATTIAIATLAFSTTTANADNGVFIGISGGPTWTSEIDVTSPTVTGTLSLTSKLGYAVGSEIGIDLDNFRVSAEIGYRKGDFDTAKLSSGGSASFDDGNYSLLTYMLNYYFTGQVATDIKPFVNVGLGFAKATLEDLSLAGVNVPNPASDTRPAMQLGLGLTFDLNKYVALDCGYKLLATETFNFNGGNLSFLNNSLTAGVRYKFL